MKTALWHKYKHRVAYWGLKFDKLVAEGGDVTMYTRMAREHDERQPYVQEDLLEALHRNNCTSYRALSMHINGWCAPALQLNNGLRRTLHTWSMPKISSLG